MIENNRMKLLIWGTGVLSESILSRLVGEIIAFVETNPKQTTFNGKRIISADLVNEMEYDVLIIAVSKKYSLDIEKRILEFKIDVSKVLFMDIIGIKHRCRYIGQLNNRKKIFDTILCLEFEKEQIPFYRYDVEIFTELHNSWKDEIKDMLAYIVAKGYVQMFNYSFSDKAPDIQICQDESDDFFYIIFDKEKVCFPKQWSHQKIIMYTDRMFKELYADSPLCKTSFTNNMSLSGNDLLIQIRPRNVFETLKLSKIFKRIVIVDCNEHIQDILTATFQHKMVQIEFLPIEKLKTVRVETYGICFLDINEGQWNSGNWSYLLNFIQSRYVSYIASTCYEYPGEALLMQDEFEKLNYQVSYSKGYVYYPYHANCIEDFTLRKALAFFVLTGGV